jgi:hypothetical protein
MRTALPGPFGAGLVEVPAFDQPPVWRHQALDVAVLLGRAQLSQPIPKALQVDRETTQDDGSPVLG